MHMRARRDIEHGTRWWARLTGVISGLAGLGIAGLASWLVAPAGSPVPAVGELIINLLPGPLVNFGKETLGHADKPVLLAIIVIAVLILCALARPVRVGQTIRRRVRSSPWSRCSGSSASPHSRAVSVNAYMPTVVGLLLGYMILSTLIDQAPSLATATSDAVGRARLAGPAQLSRLDRGGRVCSLRPRRSAGNFSPAPRPRSTRPASSSDCRPRQAGARHPRRCRSARRRPGAVRHRQRRLLPDRHRPAGAGDRPRRMDAQDHRHGRARGHDQLRRPGRASRWSST